MDVASLFLIGCLYAYFKNLLDKKILIGALLIATIFVGVYFIDLLKFPLSFLIFILLIDIQFKFFNTSRYSYLLHLYHSPIIVISYPILRMYIDNWLLLIIIQIIVALLGAYLLYAISRKYKILGIVSGGR